MLPSYLYIHPYIVRLKPLFAILFLLFHVIARAETDFIHVEDIRLEGNKHTKKGIILRELDFHVGDTIHLDGLSSRIEHNQYLLMNSGLFSSAKINIKDWEENGNVTVVIQLIERWYIWPIPFFELADRNFNVWINEYNGSLKRTNYGVYLDYANFTGSRDDLSFTIQQGFTQKYELKYNFPFVDKNKTIGLGVNFFYATNKEVAYLTEGNKELFYRNDSLYLLRRLRFGVTLNYRPGLYVNHRWYFQYHHNRIPEIIPQEYNRDFLLNGNTDQRFATLFYEMSYDRRDIKPYPKKGGLVVASFQKDGFGFNEGRNTLFISLLGAKYFTLNKKFNLDLVAKVRTELIRKKQDYYNYFGLGFYNDFLHGYEYYVIDGLDFGFFKTSLHYEAFDKTFDFTNILPFKQLKRVPIKLYLTWNTDYGYVNDPYYPANNPLVNRFLYSTGIGVDIVLLYNNVMQIEYSMNHLRERGLFLHSRANF